ncbi:YTH domain-containing protein [Phlyctema vagabunda]|uniref:YTH domain-containing protein n=1 Tax=Phlyctema vagabunda TaxID=108571 RepID=A0ABR4P1V9_9HELO
MGDLPRRAEPGGQFANHQSSGTSTSRFSTPGLYEGNEPESLPFGSPNPTSTHESNASQHQQQHGQQIRPELFNMNSLGAALPDVSYQNYNLSSQQRFPPNSSAGPMIYQVPSMAQYAGQPSLTHPANSAYNMQYQPQYQGAYPQSYPANQHTATSHQMHGGVQGGPQIYQNQAYVGQPPLQQQAASPYFVQTGQYVQNHIYAGAPTGAQFGARGNFQPGGAQQHRAPDYPGPGSSIGKPNSTVSSSMQSSVVRGPPRKPRQSGHAIWIGNLPPQTELMALVYHVCKETVGLESLFLISKSNCAFANYKDEAACSVAQSKIHDSRFQTVRLVSRLRRSSVGTVPGVSVPTGPAALTPPQPPSARTPSPESALVKEATTESGEASKDAVDDSALPKDKFFIVKSLTVEDLELSVRNGSWATQSHNEEALNKAYQAADNVYLVFSANKSGEYFGYARMVSPINDDPAAAIEFAPKAQAVEDPELPKAIPTPATEFAPKGRIIDDSARGTIFWEAERDELDEVEEEEDNRSNKSDHEEEAASKAWGKPFQVEWVSTTRLPFYRTRGLRNPWNSNREVKIARDGTELETEVGRRLLGLFHRLPSPSTTSFPPAPGLPHHIGTMPGFPQMRQYP